MPNLKRSTRKSMVRPEGLVTIAFKRTFLEGDLDGISIYGLTRQVTASEANRLAAERGGFGQDGDGNRAIDNYFHVCEAGTNSLVLEKHELTLERAALARILARFKRRVTVTTPARQ